MVENVFFPPVEQALQEPNGLLATGGDLSVDRLVEAYSRGIFPWFDEEQPPLWWSPDPRAVIFVDQIHASRSLLRTMQQANYSISMNTAFQEVIEACAEPRSHHGGTTDGTWICEEMIEAYCELHNQGHAHSFEVWKNNDLIGGLYGVAVNRVFSGESMFHRVSNASKIAFMLACKHLQLMGWPLLDCQVPNDHLSSLGVTSLPRKQFLRYLENTTDLLQTSKSEQQYTPTQWQSLHWGNTRELAKTFQ